VSLDTRPRRVLTSAAASGAITGDTSALFGGSTVTIAGRTMSPSTNASVVMCLFNGTSSSSAVRINVTSGTIVCATPSYASVGAVTLQISGDGGLNATYVVGAFAWEVLVSLPLPLRHTHSLPASAPSSSLRRAQSSCVRHRRSRTR